MTELCYEDIPILNDHKDLTHGDDYELCFTAPSHLDEQIKSQGFFLIGKIIQKLGLLVKKDGCEITFEKMDGIHLNNKVGIVGGGITGLISAYFYLLRDTKLICMKRNTLE